MSFLFSDSSNVITCLNWTVPILIIIAGQALTIFLLILFSFFYRDSGFSWPARSASSVFFLKYIREAYMPPLPSYTHLIYAWSFIFFTGWHSCESVNNLWVLVLRNWLLTICNWIQDDAYFPFEPGKILEHCIRSWYTVTV